MTCESVACRSYFTNKSVRDVCALHGLWYLWAICVRASMKAAKPLHIVLATNPNPTRARGYPLNINPKPDPKPDSISGPAGSGRVADLYCTYINVYFVYGCFFYTILYIVYFLYLYIILCIICVLSCYCHCCSVELLSLKQILRMCKRTCNKSVSENFESVELIVLQNDSLFRSTLNATRWWRLLIGLIQPKNALKIPFTN